MNDDFNLYTVDIDGGASIKLNQDLSPGRTVSSIFTINPNGTEVVYTADAEFDGLFDLYHGKAQAFWESSGGSWSSASNWRDDAPPSSVIDAIIAEPAIISVP